MPNCHTISRRTMRHRPAPADCGLGLDELSSATSQVAKIKHAIRNLDTVQCQQLVEQALHESDSAKIQLISQEFAMRNYADLFED